VKTRNFNASSVALSWFVLCKVRVEHSSTQEIPVNKHLQAIVLGTSLAVGSAFASAPGSAFAEEVKVPVSVADHAALAKQYAEKAAASKAEAESHRKMAEAYKKSVATAPKAPANPWVQKMEKHCQALAKDADKLAADSQKAADFHTLRAKELEGK
jgi:hypothetical protein